MGAVVTVKTVIDNVKGLTESLRSLSNFDVLVGIPSDKALRKNDDGEPINNAALGYIHENGAPEAGIPARPFLSAGIESAREEINKRLRSAAEAAVEGKPELVMRRLGAVGLTAQNAVRAKINEGVPPPLAPSTIAARLRRGRTGDKPLIDTGQLRNSISYVIRKKPRG